MNTQQIRFHKISGVVANLQVTQDEQNFVQTRADQAAGGVAAVGLAVGGLAGAATGALLSSSDAADTVDFFTCTIDGQPVWGRFGIVSFKDGESVEAVGESTSQGFEAYAITRPSDRTIWMYPHCSRGTKAYFWYSFKAVIFLSIFLPMLIFGVMGIISDKPFPELGAWLGLIATTGSGFSFVFAWVAWRFNKFARISDDIFAALDFETPTEVALPKRLRLARKSFSHEDHLRYSPHVRWVYKY